MMASAKIIATASEDGQTSLEIQGMTIDLLSLFTVVQKKIYEAAVDGLGEEKARGLMLMINMLATADEEEKEDAQ